MISVFTEHHPPPVCICIPACFICAQFVLLETFPLGIILKIKVAPLIPIMELDGGPKMIFTFISTLNKFLAGM